MATLTLNQISTFVRKEWLLLTLGTLSVFIFIISYVSHQSPAPKTVSSSTSWQGVSPGITTKSQLETILGKPIKSETKDNKVIYYYQSSNQYRPNTIDLANDKVTLIKEQIIGPNRPNLQDYITKYGQSEGLLYGQYGAIAPGSFWGPQGLLVFAGQNDGSILEIWYFPPISLNQFLNLYPTLKTQKPTTF